MRATAARLRSRAEQLERALFAGRVRPDEYPVLPRGEAAKHLGLRGFRAGEAQAGFHAGERVGRQRRTLFDGHADFVFPVEIVRRQGNKTEFKSLLGAKRSEE